MEQVKLIKSINLMYEIIKLRCEFESLTDEFDITTLLFLNKLYLDCMTDYRMKNNILPKCLYKQPVEEIPVYNEDDDIEPIP